VAKSANPIVTVFVCDRACYGSQKSCGGGDGGG
jgi:hypothetical protein